MLYRAVLFTFAPTALELVFVITLLATRFSPVTAALVAATFVVYVSWTLALTQVIAEEDMCRAGSARRLHRASGSAPPLLAALSLSTHQQGPVAGAVLFLFV
jgi:ABC-type transport system involved in Fe-S cluster assembly fused permease/ATPase subunit